MAVPDKNITLQDAADLARQQEPFRSNENVLLTRGGGGAFTIHPNIVPDLWRTIAAEHGFDRIRKIIARFQGPNHVDVCASTVVWGVSVQSVMEICPGVVIEPLSPSFSALMQISADLVPSQYRHQSPAILSVAYRYSPMFSVPGVDSHPNLPTASASIERLGEVTLALTLAGGTPVVAGAITHRVVDDDLAYLSLGEGYAWFHREITPGSLTTAELTQDTIWPVREFLLLSGPTKERIAAAIDRLNIALRRGDAGDKALDGSIALEIMLSSKDEKSSNSYRLSLRAALLLGGDFARRHYVRNAIKSFYELRNSTVHGGRRSRSERRESVARVGLELCTEIARALVRRKKMPNWEQLELGGEEV